MKIYLIRHGETDWNRQGRFQGREDIPLNDKGIEQAGKSGSALEGETFKAIISSPLSRAWKTAEIIAKHVGVANLIREDRITERDFSKVSGMTPKEREAFYASGEKDDKEPWDELSKRMIASIHKYAKQYNNGNIIMVSHGASINSVLSILCSGETGTGKILLKNACINVIDYNNGHMELDVFNLSAEEYIILKEIMKTS
ncbi:MAG: histidine phosphatase family protein [Mobilitalea sp.]